MTRPSYAGFTNICLVFCILSAFGFDQNGHPLWLGLGGFAGLAAIIAYFRRHWQARVVQQRLGWQDEGGMDTPIEKHGTHPHHLHLDWNEIVSTNRRVANFYLVGRYRDPDPAEQALRIVKQLPAHEKPTEVVIAGDGSVTLRFRRRAEQQPPVLRLDTELARRNPETVH